MAVLLIHLQDGFRDDSIIVRVDGAEVFKAEHISTRPQTGLARIIECESDSAVATVEIELPEKQQSSRISLMPEETPYLGVCVSNGGRVEHLKSSDQFGYV